MRLMSRRQAIAFGFKRYYTGKPCKYGHISERYVASFQCYECSQQEEHKIKKRAITKAWIKANPERAAENDRRKYEAKREEIRERIERWRKANMEKAAMSRRIRKHRVRAAGLPPKRDQIENLLNLQRFMCASCLVDIRSSYQIDHIHPVSKGGTNDISNIQLLCRPCNTRKSAKDPLVWAKENGKLL